MTKRPPMPSKISIQWLQASSLESLDPAVPVRQVYVWFITTDKKIIVVSKDGQSWQFPGGKPDTGEAPAQTAVRELYEETGVRLEDASSLIFFGYNDVTIVKEDGVENRFFQLRYYVKSASPSSGLQLTAEGEDQQQVVEDKIMHVQAVDMTQAKELIPWLEKSGEYGAIEALQVLK